MKQAANKIRRFNIRSFGSNCSAIFASAGRLGRLMFQYPLFRIELLSPDWNSLSFGSGWGFNIRSFGSNCSAALFPALPTGRWCFNIRSFGSNCSATPLYRRPRSPGKFQYPLFRIELLSGMPRAAPMTCPTVSISALSDRIAQRICQGR